MRNEIIISCCIHDNEWMNCEWTVKHRHTVRMENSTVSKKHILQTFGQLNFELIYPFKNLM